MAFTELADLGCSKAVALGGRDKKTGKANPTQIEGYFIGTRQVESPKARSGFCALHVFQTKSGNVGVWGKTNLDSKMKSATPGAMTRVTFVGMVETKNNPMYKYKVEIDKDNVIDIAASSSAEEGNFVDEDSSEDLSASGYEESEETGTEAVTKAIPPSISSQDRVKQLLNSRPKVG